MSKSIVLYLIISIMLTLVIFSVQNRNSTIDSVLNVSVMVFFLKNKKQSSFFQCFGLKVRTKNTVLYEVTLFRLFG